MSASSPALVAAQRRIKTLLETVRRLEEERGLALQRAEQAERAERADLEIAKFVVEVTPRHPKRTLDVRCLAVCLALTERARTVGELKEVLGLSQASVSEWVQSASARGLVEIQVNDSDRRKRLVQLAPKGWVAMRDRAPRGRLASEK